MSAPSPNRSLVPRAVGPIEFDVAPFDVAIDTIVELVQDRDEGLAVHFANAHNIAVADTDPEYAALFARQRAIVFTDGKPVVWIGRWQNRDLRDRWERVYGPDVMEAVLSHPQQNLRHYLLGGTEEALAALRAQIARRWPRATVVGAESPPFRALSAREVEDQDARIRDSGANCVWVGLGSPKQDREVARLAETLPVTAFAVGAAFDFLAGTKSQAPLWMQRSGTEWLYRWSREPRRLSRRYLWGNPRFLRASLRR